MKKSVIILIGVIYILAIVIVSFFGLKIETFNETVYVDEVKITNEGVKTAADGSKYVVINYLSGEEELTTYQLEWHVYPDDASRKMVDFLYDETKTIATVNGFGTVVFNKKGSITVYVSSTDGSSKMDSITIFAK